MADRSRGALGSQIAEEDGREALMGCILPCNVAVEVLKNGVEARVGVDGSQLETQNEPKKCLS